jgi:hypothetical protein
MLKRLKSKYKLTSLIYSANEPKKSSRSIPKSGWSCFDATDGMVALDDGPHKPIGQKREPLSRGPVGLSKTQGLNAVYGHCRPFAGRRPASVIA